MVAGHDLVAAAVVAKRIAEWEMHINRQRLIDAANVALGEPLPELGLAESLDEAIGSRIRGLARPADVVLAQQHRVDDQLRSGVIHFSPNYAALAPAHIDLHQRK